MRSRRPPVYPGVCRRSWRCPASAWRRSRPLLRGGSPLGYPLVLEGLYVGRSLAPAGLLRPCYVTRDPRPILGMPAPGECLVALQAPPAGRQPMGYPLVPEGLYMGCSPPQLAC